MAETIPVKIIARIRTDFATKFGVPRQSGLVESLRGEIVFEPDFRNPDALRGIEDFSHLWLIWQFSEAVRDKWQPTVRPPRLGGNQSMGVFATRSPYRPNPIGLSSAALRRLPPRCHRRLHRRSSPENAGRRTSRSPADPNPGGQAPGAPRCAGPRPPARLPERPGTAVRPDLRRVRRAVLRERWGFDGDRGHQSEYQLT